jgi:hypothetical protein
VTGRLLALAACALAGCDSLVDNPCASGFALAGGACVERADHEAPDAGPGVAPDGGAGDGGQDVTAYDAGPGPDALVCTLPAIACNGVCIDVSTDPDNCGACGHVCASGICSAGVCAGELHGHVIAIGHDYTSHNAAMARVLGNAAALGKRHDLGVARWRGTATDASVAGVTSALSASLAQLGRPWHTVALPESPSLANIDVLVIDAQRGDGDAVAAAAVPWASVIDDFLAGGGVVVVLDSAGGAGYRFAAAAGLFTIAAPVDATGVPAFVVDASDAVAQQVLSPYLAASSSASLPGTAAPVIATAAGETLVFHLAN